MVQPRRRVSYIIPSPADFGSPFAPAAADAASSVSLSSPVDPALPADLRSTPHPPRLQLPPLGVSRLGVPSPLLVPYPYPPSSSSSLSSPRHGHVREGGYSHHPHSRHGRTVSSMDAHHGEAQILQSHSQHPQEQTRQSPRHRLGVACLALDTSTQLRGKSSPEGILYTGGRDGLVISWDLGIGMRRRQRERVVDGSEDDTGSENEADDGAGRIRRQRMRRRKRRSTGRWEVLTGWEDASSFDSDGEDGDEGPHHPHRQLGSDGDVLGDVVSPVDRLRRRRGEYGDAGDGEGGEGIPYEKRWETDLEAFGPGTRSRFRQCSQAHTDWVNDILLCNYNQTLVSASSDGTVKAWSPHAIDPTDPATIGMHADYVRCLAYCREQHWVASGSFDRTIKLWDLSRSSSSSTSPNPTTTSNQAHNPSSSTPSSSSPYSHPQPLTTLNPPDSSSPKSSIYALATDPFGRLIASGGPERVVRLWDPRTGRRTAKLVGHTDVIRAVVCSDDGRYLLTGSADASIKLWSLASQRCLHTFTHHTDSVWALYSAHPALEVFYSGDRAGLVCRVDVEGVGGDLGDFGAGREYGGDLGDAYGYGNGYGNGYAYADVGDGECVVLCRDSALGAAASAGEDRGRGVNKIVVMDDNLLWTASGTSSVRRWCIPQKRAVRLKMAGVTAAAASGISWGDSTSTAVADGVDVHSQDGGRLSPTQPSVSTSHRQAHPQSHTSPSHARSPSHSRGLSASPSLRSFVSASPSEARLDVPQAQGQQLQAAETAAATGAAAGIPYASLVRLVSPNEPFALGPSVSMSGYGYGYPRGASAFGPGSASGLGAGGGGTHSSYYHYYSRGGTGGGRSGGHGAGSGLDPEVATLYSAASIMSVPRYTYTGRVGQGGRGPVQVQAQAGSQGGQAGQGSPSGSPGALGASRTEDTLMLGAPNTAAGAVGNLSTTPRSQSQTLQPYPPTATAAGPYPPPLPDLASDATPLVSKPDFIIPGSHGLVRSVILNDRIHALTVDTGGRVGVWDIVRGRCVGWFGAGDVGRACAGVGAGDAAHPGAGAAAEEPRVVVVSEGDNGGGDPAKQDPAHAQTQEAINPEIELEVEQERTSPREALEVVRERIEGEGVAATWCNADTKGGVLTIHLTERCFEAEVYADEVGFGPGEAEGGGGGGGAGESLGFNDESKLNIGKWVLRNLFIGFIQQELRWHSSNQGGNPRVHTYRQQRSVSRTPSRDTLDQNVVHSRLPTITPDNVSAAATSSAAAADPFQTQAQAQYQAQAQTPKASPNSPNSSTILSSPDMIPAIAPAISSPVRSSPLLAPLIPLHVLAKDAVAILPSIPQSPNSPAVTGVTSADVTPTPGAVGLALPLHQRTRSGTIDGSMSTPLATAGGLVTPGVGGGAAGKEDYFSLRTRQGSVSHAASGIGGVGTPTDDFSGWAGPAGRPDGKSDQQQQQQPPRTPSLPPPTPQTPSTPGGLMSRFRGFGKISKRPVSDVPNTPSTLTTPAAETPTQQAGTPEVVPSPVQKILLSETLSPPTSLDAPLHALPPNTTVMISEEAQPSYHVLYRGDVARVHEDVQALEEAMPLWLAEYLLLNRAPQTAPLAKLSFVLMPWNKDPDAEPLPELLNTQQSKLTASRYLRVKKIAHHVQDKLERIALTAGTRSGTNSIRSSVDGQGPNQHQHQHHEHPRPRAEDEYEILCNDVVLPLGMTLAAVRQYVWRQGAELVMHYRRKRNSGMSLSSRPHVFN